MDSSSYFYHYFFIGVYTLFAFVFALLPVLIAKKISPTKPSPVKNATFECGLESTGDAWIQFRIQYYLIALVFVVFDVETLFIYPWALSFKETGLVAFIEMFVFIAILAIGLAYAWKEKIFEWE